MNEKPTTLSGLCRVYIKEAENGNTITSKGLKSLATTTLEVLEKYQEQNSYGFAFQIVAKRLLTPETLKRLEEETTKLVELEKSTRENNG